MMTAYQWAMESRVEWKTLFENIRIGTDDQIDDDEGGLVKLDLLDKEIIVRLKNLDWEGHDKRSQWRGASCNPLSSAG